MTAFPSLPNPLGFRRILSVDVRQRMRSNLTLERIWVNRHVRHAFEFPWQALTPAQRTTLAAFMVTCRGRITADIDFTDPWDSVAYVCRLDSDELVLTAASPLHWSGSLRLIEVSGWEAIKAAVTAFPATVPFQSFASTHRYRTVIEAAEDDAEKRYEDFSAGIMRWTAGGSALTNAQADALIDAWEGNGGPWRAFSLTDPITSTAYPTCHFADIQIAHTMLMPGVNSVTAVVEELK